MDKVQALTFDVFGTVVDWRGTLARELELDAAKTLPNAQIDWVAFVEQWRSNFWKVAENVRQGADGPRRMDDMNREILETMLQSNHWAQVGAAWNAAKRDEVTHLWHKLDGFPDSVPALNEMKKRIIIAALSNGNMRLLVDMAKHAGLPWDVIFSAEAVSSYKPDPKVYHHAINGLAIQPSQCAMVAAHIMDLRGAAAAGMKTIYVRRHNEDHVADGEGIVVKTKEEGGEVDAVVDSLAGLLDIFPERPKN